MNQQKALPRLDGEELKTVHHVGSRQGKHTGWHLWPGYSDAEFESGRRMTLPKDLNWQQEVDWLKDRGADVEEYEIRISRRHWGHTHAYPEIPTYATEFQHNYGYETPTLVEKWGWSSTFGRWSAIVTFADGWRGYTYPRLKPDDPWYAWLERNRQKSAC